MYINYAYLGRDLSLLKFGLNRQKFCIIIALGSRKKEIRHRKRRTQSDILISVLKCTPLRQSVSINEIAKKCNMTWRTTRRNIEVLNKAGVIEKIKDKKRVKYKRS